MTNDSPADSDTDAGTEEPSCASSNPSPAWMDAMEDIFDTAVDRQAEIECEINDMEIEVPLQLGAEPDFAEWKVNGTLQFRFDGIGGPLAEWFRWRDRQQRLDEQPSESTQD
jgi:hypothetical protein